jgi:hypothetical protein
MNYVTTPQLGPIQSNSGLGHTIVLLRRTETRYTSSFIQRTDILPRFRNSSPITNIYFRYGREDSTKVANRWQHDPQRALSAVTEQWH